MKGAWPVEANGTGGRHYRGDYIDQNFDTYSVEYTFADGTQAVPRRPQHRRLPQRVRQLRPRHQGLGGHLDRRPLAGQVPDLQGPEARRKDDLVWAFPQPEPNPYQLEWDDLIDAIRKDKPYNEVKRGVEASLVTSMGRMAAHTGQVVTFDEMLNCEHEFAPDVDKLTMDGARAAPDPAQRQVPRPPARHRPRPRIRLSRIALTFRSLSTPDVPTGPAPAGTFLIREARGLPSRA